jgi:hypothetical protein
MIIPLENRSLFSNDLACSLPDALAPHDNPASHALDQEAHASPFAKITAAALAPVLGTIRVLPELVLTSVALGGVKGAFKWAPLPMPFAENMAMIGATFVAYPLSYLTIESLADPELCKDPAFCGGWLSHGMQSFSGTLDSWVDGLYEWANPVGEPLPLLNPKMLYYATTQVGSVLFTAIGAKVFLPQGANLKISLPHLEVMDRHGMDEDLHEQILGETPAKCCPCEA